MAPKPTNKATDANVLPKPVNSVGKILSTEMPAASAVNKLTKTNATKACILNLMISSNNKSTATIMMKINIIRPHVKMLLVTYSLSQNW